mgnify:CR=1 FL=1
MATEFLAANGCRVIASEADADMAGDDIPVMFVTAHVPGRRWSVEFEEVHPPGMWKSNTRIIVYIWANKDIAETMERIKDDLNARRTDITVRAEQTRVVEQLDAMIRNLAVKPPEDKFEQAGGGGGGGSAGV